MVRNQVEMFTTLDGFVLADHPYRKFEAVIDFDGLARIVPFVCLLYSFSKMFRIEKWNDLCKRTWRANGFVALV